mmetsp:Transcript_33525/g.72444  ORF Transcript_33525/g.72444 Transcript_33525/m.72444 type:complete len:85 (+) Transcript_33525:477-731(+)
MGEWAEAASVAAWSGVECRSVHGARPLSTKGLQGRVGHAKARRGRPQVPRLVELLAKGHRSTPSSSSSFSMVKCMRARCPHCER